MKIVLAKDHDEMSRRAAAIVAAAIGKKPRFVLGLGVSDALLGTYAELCRLHREEGLDFSRVDTFNVDEHFGLGSDDPRSCRHFMDRNLFDHVNVDPRNINIPNGLTRDPAGQCRKYEKAIEDVAGIDLLLLGIGRDGRIGFNEPGSSLGSRTRVKTLSEESRRERGEFFEKHEEVPRFAITMGVGTIMEARRLLVLVSGSRKADVLLQTVEGPISSSVPASILQLHGDATVVADEDAAAHLKRKDYYRYVEKVTRELESGRA